MFVVKKKLRADLVQERNSPEAEGRRQACRHRKDGRQGALTHLMPKL